MWDGCFEYDSEKIEKIQLEAARIVTGLIICAFQANCATVIIGGKIERQWFFLTCLLSYNPIEF
jgi:hypothetical protein